MNLEMRKFNMASIKSDSVVIFIGKRNTGKSFLTKDLLFHHQDIPVGVVISATEAANGFYGKIVPSMFIHKKYEDSIIGKFLKRQQKTLLVSKQACGEKIDPRAFLILDDCLYDNSWTKSEDIRSVFMNGRHFNIFFILTMQYVMGIPPNLRGNTDYVFILRENIQQNRKRLYDCYAGMFANLEVFCQVMNQCTANFECLVIHNASKSNLINEQVFWYKAEERPDFKMGANSFWDYNDRNLSEADDGDDDQFSIEKIRKNKFMINVKKNDEYNTDINANSGYGYNNEQTNNYYSNNGGNNSSGGGYSGDYYSGAF
jgi:hypothetical protein